MECYFKKNGSVSPKQGRPVKGVASSFDKGLMERISYYRGLHDKWGAGTIRCELITKDKYEAASLPSESTIERYLRSLSVCAPRNKHRPLEKTAPRVIEQAHDCWQMDDKGVENYGGVGHVGTINIKDVHSGTHVQALPLPFSHKRCHPDTGDYQCALRLAFCEFGLPKYIQADHGSNFYENKCASPFPTPLHLWLLGLGIELTWARIYRPTDQAKVERTHQVLHNQIQQTFDFDSWYSFKRTIDERRYALNHTLPCASIGKPPLVACPSAKHSGRFFNPLTEEQLFDEKRIKQYLKGKEWFRKVSQAKTISLGGQVYYLKNAQPKRELKISFKYDYSLKEDLNNLIFYDDKELLAQIPIKGIDFQNLVEPHFFLTLKSLQFEFPFDWANAKINTTF